MTDKQLGKIQLEQGMVLQRIDNESELILILDIRDIEPSGYIEDTEVLFVRSNSKVVESIKMTGAWIWNGSFKVFNQ